MRAGSSGITHGPKARAFLLGDMWVRWRLPDLRGVMQIPAGYEPYEASEFSQRVGPIYRSTDGSLRLGLVADTSHANTMGGVHGGLLLTLADSAIGGYVKSIVGPGSVAVTTDLHASFLLGARVGQWIEAVPELDREGQNMVFASARLYANERPVARVQATFYVHRRNRSLAQKEG